MTSFMQHIADKAVRYMNDGLPPDTVGVFAKLLTPLDPLTDLLTKTVGECGYHDLQPRLCYPPCPPGQHGVLFEDSPVCTADCPEGTTDLVTQCTYGNTSGAYSSIEIIDRGPGRLAHTGLKTSSCAFHFPEWMGGMCMPGFVCDDCASNEQAFSPCWCAPVCDANEDASLGNGNPLNICYHKCRPNFTGHLTMCNRNKCDGDDEEHVLMCYKKCQPGFTQPPTGLFCEQDKKTSTRFPYVRWTSECDPGDTDLGQAPLNRLGMCWYGTGYFRVTNISGFSKMRITSSEFALDCTAAPHIMHLKCKIDCPIQINFEWGFKICTGLPFAYCDDPVYPTYNHPHQVNHALDLEFEISLPFTIDFKDVNVDLSGVQLHVSRIGVMEAVVAEAVAMVRPSIDAAAAVIRSMNIFNIDAIRDFQEKVEALYQQFLPLVANGGQQISDEIVKLVNEVLKDPMGNDHSFIWPFVNAGDVCAPPGPPLSDFACGPNASCSAPDSEFGLFEGGCGRLKYVYPLTLWSAGAKSMSWMTNEKYGPDVGTQYLTQGGPEPRAFVFVPTAPNATTYHLALAELPGALVTRTVIANNPTIGYFVQVNDPVKTPPRGAGLITAVFTIECGAFRGSIRIKVVDDKFPNLYLAMVPYPISWITYMGGAQTQVENPNRPGTFVAVNFDFYTNASYPPEFGIPHGPIVLNVPGKIGEGLAVIDGEVKWGNGNESGLFTLEQNPFNDRTFYMRFSAGVLQQPASALMNESLLVKQESESSIMTFKEEYANAMIVQPYRRNPDSSLFTFAVVSPKYQDMYIYARTPAPQPTPTFGILSVNPDPLTFYTEFAL